MLNLEAISATVLPSNEATLDGAKPAAVFIFISLASVVSIVNLFLNESPLSTAIPVTMEVLDNSRLSQHPVNKNVQQMNKIVFDQCMIGLPKQSKLYNSYYIMDFGINYPKRYILLISIPN
ncbi:hypothetical protein LXM54_05690 [Bacillus sp. Au-Bac7]|nr:hypothetical protein [Bacillus sp. Au-Bac7]MCE4047999.1 hypothetical protein [Bacillus sp. Au-Bac7]